MPIIVCCLIKDKTLALNTKVSTMKQRVLIQFGSKVRELRRLKGLSQEELADRASLHRTYIGMIERGERNITLINIEKISMALEIDIYEFFLQIKYE